MHCSDCSGLHKVNLDLKIIITGPIPQSKGMGAFFQKKGKEMLLKGQNVWKFRQKWAKFENI